MRTLTEWTLGGNMHPDDPTAKRPMDHGDFTRRYRHAFTACMVEAGHVPCQWLRVDGHLHLIEGRPSWTMPDADWIDWTEEQCFAWIDAAAAAARLCEAVR